MCIQVIREEKIKGTVTISFTNRGFVRAKSSRFSVSCIGQSWVYSFTLRQSFQDSGQYLTELMIPGQTCFFINNSCHSQRKHQMIQFGLHSHLCCQAVRKLRWDCSLRWVFHLAHTGGSTDWDLVSPWHSQSIWPSRDILPCQAVPTLPTACLGLNQSKNLLTTSDTGYPWWLKTVWASSLSCAKCRLGQRMQRVKVVIVMTREDHCWVCKSVVELSGGDGQRASQQHVKSRKSS